MKLAIAPGSAVTYTLTINNIGTANATDIKVTDTLPAGITGLSATATSLFSCSFVGQTLTCLKRRRAALLDFTPADGADRRRLDVFHRAFGKADAALL